MEHTSSLTADSESSPGSRVTVSRVRPIWRRKARPGPREAVGLRAPWYPLDSRLESGTPGLGVPVSLGAGGLGAPASLGAGGLGVGAAGALWFRGGGQGRRGGGELRDMAAAGVSSRRSKGSELNNIHVCNHPEEWRSVTVTTAGQRHEAAGWTNCSVA